MAILVAIDDNERSKIAVTIAADLATVYDDTLVALHVVPKEDFKAHQQSMESISDIKGFSLSQEAESAKRFARKFVLDTVDDLDSERLEVRGRVGSITDEIISETESLDPRFLVISGRRRSPTGKAIFKNTAQQILLNVDCPVVTQLSDT